MGNEKEEKSFEIKRKMRGFEIRALNLMKDFHED